LPRPIIIPGIATLVTLADVKSLIERDLTTRCRQKAAWRYVAERLVEAARDGDTMRVAVALRMVLSMEGIECRPQATPRRRRSAVGSLWRGRWRSHRRQ